MFERKSVANVFFHSECHAYCVEEKLDNFCLGIGVLMRIIAVDNDYDKARHLFGPAGA